MFHFLTKRTERTQRGAALAKTNISIALLSLFLLFTLAVSCVATVTTTEETPAEDIAGAPVGKVIVGFEDSLELYLPDGTVAESVSWSSSDSDIVEIIDSSTGSYITRGVGTATISYSYNTKTGSTTITVTDIEVLAISIDIDSASKPAGSINISDTGTLTASISPADHTDGNIRWNSSNSEFVSINARTGVYIAIGTGTATITAQIGSVSDTTDIQVLGNGGGGGESKAAQSIAFIPTPPDTLTQGDTGTFSVVVLPIDHTDGDIVWQSGPPGLLEITSTGPNTASYLATSTGTVTITASVGSASPASHIVTITSGGGGVTTPATNVLVSASFPPTLMGGDTGTFSVIVLPSDHTDGDVVWESDNPDVLSVTSTDPTTASYVAGTAGGTATITMTVGTATNSRTITVTPSGGGGVDNPAQLVLISASFPPTLDGGDTGTFSVVVLPADHTDGDVVWESDNPDVLSVSSTDPTTASYIAGTAGGTATITMTVGTATNSRTITVTPSGGGGVTTPATNVLVSASFPPTLTGGDTGTFSVVVLPSDHTDGAVVWESDNPDVLSVTSTDPTTASYVAGTAGGTATITMTVGTATNTRTITVTPSGGGGVDNPAQLVLISASFPYTLTGGDTGTFSVAILPANHTDGDVVWESDNPDVLSVSSTGPTTASYIAGTAGGTATITMTVGTATNTRTITVTP